ncbi:precorrin-3B C(17)-methyltransferase [Cohnella mopanensis]|uniref:precorrin-3B C(17)-methyltransferase n=1 Tax=Cohnella mopanensis TaxID=2911966 RepID=UPI001EF7FD3F|nr:precorrin-3B C(17)-methyltransferase [Cohnella mopanensis]
MAGKLLIIGFGPGSFEHITKRAREALQESNVVIGYNTYVDLIRGLLTDQQIVRTGMTEEVSRAQEAVRQAEAGKKVAVISSGDAGVYGMAGLVYEVLMEKGWNRKTGVEVEIIPGISAINSSASLLGAPVMHDACTISLSDHLTPWDLIAKRVDAAGQADFVIALYNPRSGRRTRQIVETQRILLKYRSPETPVGIVKSAYRERQHVVLTTLREMLDHDIGMLTTVIIGNSSTVVYDGLMITPRGYQRKYTLGADVQPLRPHQRLQQEAEPWALRQWTDEDEELYDEELDNEDLIDADDEEQENELDEMPTSRLTQPSDSSNKVVGSLALAIDALQLVDRARGIPSTSEGRSISGYATAVAFKQQEIFEFAVSTGVADKRFTSRQMLALADVVGEKGTMDYTPHHQMIVRVPTSDPDAITTKLREEGFLLSPIGDVAQIKACDFCDKEKGDSIPYAEELQRKVGGVSLPKEMKIGFNGCGMACYGAVQEDIGVVYRKGKFDLFLGGKTIGRNVHPAQPVAEGIEPTEIVAMIDRIVKRYRAEGHPNERFHKFFKRVKEIEGFRHQDQPVFEIENAICGD